MSIPIRPIPTTSTKPSQEEFFDYIATTAQTAIMHCECAKAMAQIGDPDALAYHISGLVGAARLARDVMRDYRATHAQEHEDAA